MQVCKSIEKVEGGFIVQVRFPYGLYHNDGKVVCQTWAEVIDLLTKAANEEPEASEERTDG